MTAHDASAERVANEIRLRIIRQQLLPGEKLGQQQLAEDLGVSRVPVREGMLILANQGVLTHQNNTGFVVTKRTAEEMMQIQRMQSALEPELFKDIRWPDAAEIKQIREVNRILRPNAPKSTTLHQLVEANGEFHRIVWGLSSSYLIVQEMLRIWGIAYAYSARDFVSRAKVTQSFEEHEKIIVALEARDLKQLLRATTAHRKTAYESSTSSIAR